ncbi:hypothetical protein PSEUDO8Z_10036 [Pseudomonas sp. 8Z]|uniref:winged helix-turn-helix domain-containing protein n=1 Tax=Pseudomonas sp. 8Z TaxID=2653166 RepID=UPI0012F2D9A8|nr:winged helix-turn-helix domain-containing protein [Pseudomonas sp. 8Z]VXC05823.1 hypothetical protein PSEUDO8Z_10036 [Pseudomonas sp. 8Z]
MHDYDWLLLAAFSLLVLAPAPFLGRYFYRVTEGQRTWLSPVLLPVERLCYRVADVDPQQEQSWRGYALALLAQYLGRVVTQQQLLRDIWGPSHVGDSHCLRVVVGHLRPKLGDDSAAPRYLITEAGVGYRLRADGC